MSIINFPITFRIALILVLFQTITLQLQGQDSDQEILAEKLKQLSLEQKQATEDQNVPTRDEDSSVVPDPPCDCKIDSVTYRAYLQSLTRYYEYRIHGFDHRQKIFEWQYLSSRIIFVIVILLVLAGIYFAAVQFHRGLRIKDPKSMPDKATEIVLSYKSVSVKSPVLGVIILVLSLAFFYLYLVYVYPIENIF